MHRAISTHVFLRQRLHADLLDAMLDAGAQGIEIFAARHHFDYSDRGQVREIANWFNSNPVEFNSLHQPIYFDTEWSRNVGSEVNVIHPEKSRRIDAMDEVKRAIEVAETIPVRSVVIHLGSRSDAWNTRALENSLTAIEHLKTFAHPLGVQLLLENIQNEVTEPLHLLEILRVGHFDNVDVCFDAGHAHLGEGVGASFEILKQRVRALHLHDNHGQRDEHLWPAASADKAGAGAKTATSAGSGTGKNGMVDWRALMRSVASLSKQPIGVLETAYEPEESVDAMSRKAAASFAALEKAAAAEANGIDS